jgi:hypothetical protein
VNSVGPREESIKLSASRKSSFRLCATFFTVRGARPSRSLWSASRLPHLSSPIQFLSKHSGAERTLRRRGFGKGVLRTPAPPHAGGVGPGGGRVGLHEREHGDPSPGAALGKGLRAPHRLKPLPNIISNVKMFRFDPKVPFPLGRVSVLS